MSDHPTRVVIVDDHAMFRAGVRAEIGAHPGVEVVGEAGAVDEAVAVVGPHPPHAVLLDLHLPAGVRGPDFFDDGRAFWLHGEGVVHVDSEHLERVKEALTQPRFVVTESGWIRRHPSEYGVEVEAYVADASPLRGRAHDAQTAWRLLAEAVTA